ncbi:unnamed protein product [Lactuca saligna]|uniref:ACT domain-containing protein ACR n=1 Tax=Lactuca saligna TaxID=75948 RepID=A0AA36DWR1_LACSI|nr:unnamed protein product [Lactuca saligna]
MGMSWEDVVLIERSKTSGDPTVVTVNCPDKAGLGCDLLRIVLEFGLYVTRGDFSTDGRWCYVVLWVVPRPSSMRIDWESLKNRLLSCCPSCLPTFYLNHLSGSDSDSSKSPPLYLLKVFSLDRKGLIHDVTKVLCDLDLAIQRVKVTTTPDGKVLDLFFITDGMELLHTKIRREETCEHLSAVLGGCCITCELEVAGTEYDVQQGHSCISETVAQELFGGYEVDVDRPQSEASITVDNLLSPTHTLLQIRCLDQKGLVYDIFKISKDCNIRIVHGRIWSSDKGLKEEMLNPLRVMITNRGPDTELVVANPVELSGKGRPRVFYDATLALKTLGICVFSAEIGRHSSSRRQWEVYRFLLDESRGSNNRAKRDVVDKVRRTLMGW